MTAPIPGPAREPPVGVWLGASRALGRPVQTTEPYPHIHGRSFVGQTTGQMVRLTRRDCPACHTSHQATSTPDITPDESSVAPVIDLTTRRRIDPKGQNTMELRTHHQALLRNALSLAARGWYVFPLRPGDKRPAFPDHAADRCTGADPRCRSAGGHVRWETRATVDPDRIRRAWSRRPYNVGIACGPSGLVVVDLDIPKPGKDTPPPAWAGANVRTGVDVFTVVCARAGQPVPAGTYTVTTGRRGTHLYFQHPAGAPLRNTTGERGQGLGWLIDTRAHGGYVVAAGSVVAGQPYQVVCDVPPTPLPGWLSDRLRTLAPVTPPHRPVTVTLGTDRRAAYLHAALERQAGYVTATTSDRNAALYMAAQNLGQLVAGGDLPAGLVEQVLTDAAHQVGLHRDPPPGQIPRTIASGLRAGARRPRSVAA